MDNRSQLESVTTEFTTHQNHQLDAAMDKIEHCIGQLSIDQLWNRSDESSNSIANLLIHLAGNLRQWAIVPCRGVKDERDRESEFTAREQIPADKLMGPLRSTVKEAKDEIGKCDAAKLIQQHTIQGFDISLIGALTHTTTHFVGHTHQIIMLTRQMLGDAYEFHWKPDSDRDKVPV